MSSSWLVIICRIEQSLYWSDPRLLSNPGQSFSIRSAEANASRTRCARGSRGNVAAQTPSIRKAAFARTTTTNAVIQGAIACRRCSFTGDHLPSIALRSSAVATERGDALAGAKRAAASVADGFHFGLINGPAVREGQKLIGQQKTHLDGVVRVV